MHIKAGVERNAATPARREAVSTRLLLIANDSAELPVLRAALVSERMQVLAIEVKKLERVFGQPFDVASVRADAPTPLWQEVISLVRLRWGIPVMCMLPIPELEQVPLVADLHADALAFLPLRCEEVSSRIELLAWQARQDVKRGFPFMERRNAARFVRASPAIKPASPAAEGLVVDDREKKVMLGGRAICLSPIQFRLMVLLASDPGRVFSIPEICAHLWPRKRVQSADVQQLVYLLRHKIEKDAANPIWVQTQPGFGYKLNRPEYH